MAITGHARVAACPMMVSANSEDVVVEQVQGVVGLDVQVEIAVESCESAQDSADGSVEGISGRLAGEMGMSGDERVACEGGGGCERSDSGALGRTDEGQDGRNEPRHDRSSGASVLTTRETT